MRSQGPPGRGPAERDPAPPPPGRGSQYTSARYLEGYGTRPSVGRTGVRWADAWAESFNEWLARQAPSRTPAQTAWPLPDSPMR